ncbi:MAG: phenylalanine--tRNA ligase subunit beta [Planctomycetaceae bacterium]|nr:phenylalanine--tRNA ligase subunit beta [Planctomycetaceae bacterium]
MIVSWNWLREYVSLDMSAEELTHRLTMSGLNLEEFHDVDGDMAIDIEVTSNRPDCLGHLGVAREIGVLFDRPVNPPAAEVEATSEPTADVTSVQIECPELCPQYIARVIRGVKVGPSPDWMQARLRTVGITPINNLVDVTNYVLMECGQPLHAFDFDKLGERRIVVRRARPGETMEAIDHKTYMLTPDMCIIADAARPVAIGGVMGGAATEIGERTTNVLIETANFAPLAIRGAARKLSLFSDSSYRFERGIDEQQLLWASNRCCELILATAGGTLLKDPVIAGEIPAWKPEPIVLRFPQIERVLGIEIPRSECIRILTALGLLQHGDGTAASASFLPPSWRRDLTREIDLIEEIARIHGYEQVPENTLIPIVATKDTDRDVVIGRASSVLTAAGFYEAVTMSFVSRETFDLFTPHADVPPLTVEHSSRRHENILRQSLVPNLLVSRRENERQGVFDARLFEIAAVYIGAAPEDPTTQPTMLSFVTGGSFAEVRGLLEAIAKSVNAGAIVATQPADVSQFVPGRGAEVLLNGQPWGWAGQLDRKVTDRLDLRDEVTAVEVRLSPLLSLVERAPQFVPLPQFPAIERDVNFVLDDAVSWDQLERTVAASAGPLLDSVRFVDQYRGQQIPVGKKSYVLSIAYRSPARTLTSDEVDAAQMAVVSACSEKLGAMQR